VRAAPATAMVLLTHPPWVAKVVTSTTRRATMPIVESRALPYSKYVATRQGTGFLA
jgi:hypothetical protein